VNSSQPPFPGGYWASVLTDPLHEQHPPAARVRRVSQLPPAKPTCCPANRFPLLLFDEDRPLRRTVTPTLVVEATAAGPEGIEAYVDLPPAAGLTPEDTPIASMNHRELS
jgi:hypothetical protein